MYCGSDSMELTETAAEGVALCSTEYAANVKEFGSGRSDTRSAERVAAAIVETLHVSATSNPVLTVSPLSSAVLS
jgi:hypothetical protein